MALPLLPSAVSRVREHVRAHVPFPSRSGAGSPRLERATLRPLERVIQRMAEDRERVTDLEAQRRSCGDTGGIGRDEDGIVTREALLRGEHDLAARGHDRGMVLAIAPDHRDALAVQVVAAHPAHRSNGGRDHRSRSDMGRGAVVRASRRRPGARDISPARSRRPPRPNEVALPMTFADSLVSAFSADVASAAGRDGDDAAARADENFMRATGASPRPLATKDFRLTGLLRRPDATGHVTSEVTGARTRPRRPAAVVYARRVRARAGFSRGLRIGADFFERRGWVAAGAPAAWSIASGTSPIPASTSRIDPRVVAFFDDTAGPRAPHPEPLGLPILAPLARVLLPRSLDGPVRLSARREPDRHTRLRGRSRKDGRPDARGILRTYVDSNDVMQAVSYATWERDGRRFMAPPSRSSSAA